MSNFYLPVYDKDSRKNNIKIYNMEYNRETLNEFLEYVRVCYQDKHLTTEVFNSKGFPVNHKYFDITSSDPYEYKVNPVIYSIFCDLIKAEFLKLRPLGLYMRVNFDQKIPNNYTENEKDSILLQLKKDKNIAKDVHVADKDKISNNIYMVEQVRLKRDLTISEKDMLIREFEDLVVKFFDLFEIDEIKYKRHHSKGFEFETAIFNKQILEHDSFQKVYKKIF